MGVQPITVPKSLTTALTTAGDKSGVDFDYLLNTAMRESSLDPTAKAPTSSATGLFQFLDSTWLQVMKTEGPRLGYQRYADAIQQTASGDFVVPDKGMRAEILKLREEPQVSADLAAAYTRENGDYLRQSFGRMPSPGELYIAHFLGAQGAETLFRAGLSNPDQNAANLFPQQARANPTIFYHDGRARSIKELYRVLVAGQQGSAATAAAAVAAPTEATAAGDPTVTPAFVEPATSSPSFATQQMASGRWPIDEVPSRYGPDSVSFNSLFANEAAVPGRLLMSPASEAQGPALFTQLYGQGQVQPLTETDAGQPPEQPLLPQLDLSGGNAFTDFYGQGEVQPLDPLPMPPPGSR